MAVSAAAFVPSQCDISPPTHTRTRLHLATTDSLMGRNGAKKAHTHIKKERKKQRPNSLQWIQYSVCTEGMCRNENINRKRNVNWFLRTNSGDGTIPNEYQANGRANSAETNQNKYFCTQEFTIDFSLSLRVFLLSSSFFCSPISSFFLSHVSHSIPQPMCRYRSFVWFFILWWHRLWMNGETVRNYFRAITPSQYDARHQYFRELWATRWIRGRFDVLQSHRFQLRARAANDQ